MVDNISYRLLFLVENTPGWCSFSIEGSNGAVINGGMAETLEVAKEKVKLQLEKANGRRMVRQRWVYWGWNLEKGTP